MEIIIILLLTILILLPIVMVVWFKAFVKRILNDATNKLNYLNAKIEVLGKTKEPERKEEDHMCIDENLLSLMESLPLKDGEKRIH